MRIKRSRKVVVAASIAIVMAGGAAFAYWAFGGAGNGSATTASNAPSGIVISQAAPTGSLAPGDQVNLAGLLTNSNNTDIKVGTLTAEVTGASNAGVALSDFSIGGNPQVISKVVKKGTPVSWSGLTLKYANSDVNQDNAKNTTVTIKYTLTPFVEPPAAPATGTFSFVNHILAVSDVASWPTATGAMTIQAGDQLYVHVPAAGLDAASDQPVVDAVNGKFNYASTYGFYILSYPGVLELKRGGVFYPRTPAWTID